MYFITSVPGPILIVYPYKISYKIEGRRKGYNEILDLIFHTFYKNGEWSYSNSKRFVIFNQYVLQYWSKRYGPAW